MPEFHANRLFRPDLRRRAWHAVWLWLSFLISPLSYAEDAPRLQAQAAESVLQEVTQSSQLSEEQKKSLAQQLEKSTAWLNESHKSEQTLTGLRSLLTDADKQLSVLQRAQKDLLEKLANFDKSATPPAQQAALSAALGDLQPQLETASQQLREWDKTLNDLLPLATEGATRLAQLETTQRQLADTALSSETQPEDPAAHVQVFARQARLQALADEQALLRFKIEHLSQLTQLAQNERDRWYLQKTLLTKQNERWQSALQNLKAAEAEALLQRTLEQLIDEHSPLYTLHQQVIALQQEKSALLQQEKQLDQKIGQSRDAIATIKTHYDHDKQIVALEGSRDAIAQVLHKRIESLDKLEVPARERLKTQQRTNQMVLQHLLLNERLRDLGRLSHPQLLQHLLGDNGVNELQGHQLEQEAERLQEEYLQAAKGLQGGYAAHISKLAELNAAYEQQLNEIVSYRRFLNDHLLWLPNVPLTALWGNVSLDASLQAMFAAEGLGGVLGDATQALRSHPLQTALWLILLGALLATRQRTLQALAKAAARTTSIRTDAYRYTLQAAFFTLLLSLPLPLLLTAGAWILQQADAPGDLTLNLIETLYTAALLMLMLLLVQHSCRNDGLAERHFRWHASVRHALRTELRWVVPLSLLLVLLIGLSGDASRPAEQQLLGRLALIVLMAAMLLAVYRLWSSPSEIMRDFQQASPRQGWLQLHFVWFPLLLALPLFLMWTTFAGYYYSSLVIAERLNWTLALILLIYLLRELLLRSLYLSERQQHYAERLQKRQAQLTQQNPATETNPAELADEPQIDYEKLSKQVRQALNLVFILAFLSGVWFIWKEILPALNLISDSTLSLTKSQVVDGVIQQVPLTLGDLVWGIALGAMTLLLAKDLPGLLEFLLLKNLPISSAARYAISTLTQYIIAIIGLVMIFRALGIEWSNIQWLVAALSVGLGFGLQEIVANFVSGIILLFEQPIRVGDIVTVNGVSGKVSRIRIRATTIVNWDRQELVIPNKQIITGQFINWSLSDQVTRIRIDVGVAYGSDVTRALELIREAALAHPKVLKDPEPFVVFEGFGDNALQLSLRAYVDDLDEFIGIRSELNSAIHAALDAAHIVIAFPQRDVHLDTSQPLEIRLSKAPKESAGKSAGENAQAIP